MRNLLTVLTVAGLASVALAGAPDGSERCATTAAQAGEMFQHVKHSLADSIKIAERKADGRAIAAECRFTGVAKNAQDGKAKSDVVCVVTVLTKNNALSEVRVCSETGEVVAMKPIDSAMAGGGADGVQQAAYSEAGPDDAFAFPRRWQKATDLTGKGITNVADEDLGSLKNIVVDAESGRILYGVVSFGGFLGLGDKLFAVPWSSLRLTDDAKKIILNVDRERLKNAQGFDEQHWPNFADERWATTNYESYGQKPYWNDQSSGKTYRDRWTQRVVQWQKATDLCGKAARTRSNEDIGSMSDLAIDPDSGRVIYGILKYDGKFFAVPWNAVDLTSDMKYFTLGVDKSALKLSDGFSNDRWPDFTNRQWAGEVHKTYNVQPYWMER